jgi:hypothetical protein
LVFEVADGVTTPEEGRELVSRAAESISLSPDCDNPGFGAKTVQLKIKFLC